MKSLVRCLFAGAVAVLIAGCKTTPEERPFTNLFPVDGVPKGWVVRNWSNVADKHPENPVWRVEKGVLHGSDPRGTWLVSEKEYGNFILEFEFMLPERGNSGIGLRFPDSGDPAFDGLELQMVDPRYHGDEQVPDSELTGSLYRALAPRNQVFKPMAWNKYEIACYGPEVKVVLNGVQILDVNLDEHKTTVLRHNGAPASSLKDRPRRGHIGFQELSRGGGHVQIRNVRIKELD